jgi:hypothetical protein
MSGHADATPRIHESMHFYEIVEQWDALVAENQQLRDALAALVRWWDLGDGDPDDQFEAARAALRGTPSEDT